MTQETMAEKKAKLVAALKAQNEQKNNQGGKSSGGDNASYRFWDINEGDTAVIRFLPDADESNTFFWRKREVIRLPFEGIINSDNNTDKKVTVTVPCVNMWGQTCPIQSHTKSWWKTDKEPIARTYWKKKSYLYQGFVVTSPFNEENAPENPIRRFVINADIHAIIEQSLLDPEMDLPTDYVSGCDFRITKGKKGQYADYGASSWARRTRSLSEQEMEAIETYGLYDLNEYLGKQPNADELKIIEEMFFDSLDGAPYDMAKYGKFFKPYGASSAGTGGSVAPADDDQPVFRPAATSSVSAPAATTQEDTGSSSDARALLERIKKNRKAEA